MKCVSCGMTIPGKPIREEIEGVVYYYCCVGCFEQELCRRDRPLRRSRGASVRREAHVKHHPKHSKAAAAPIPGGRRKAGMGLLAVMALALVVLNAPGVSATEDLVVELSPHPPENPILPDAEGKAVFEESKKGTKLELEAEGLTLPGDYFVCLGSMEDMTDHVHFPLVVDKEGEAELDVKLDQPLTSFSGQHVCVGLQVDGGHVMVLIGMIP